MNIVIIDYGMGNIGSIRNMLGKAGTQAIISSQIEVIQQAQKLILPGVGAFDEGMKNLKEYNLIDILNKKVLEEKTPILGICLGMQLFSSHSQEGMKPGLNWLNAQTIKFIPQNNRKIPHMGWNTIEIRKKNPILDGLPQDSRFYFVHSYHVVCAHEEDVLAVTSYHGDFVSALHKGNIWGTQFHPEKSHRFGLKLLSNFVNNI